MVSVAANVATITRQLDTRQLDTLGIEPRAFRMRSGCDTTTPCARWRHIWTSCQADARPPVGFAQAFCLHSWSRLYAAWSSLGICLTVNGLIAQLVRAYG